MSGDLSFLFEQVGCEVDDHHAEVGMFFGTAHIDHRGEVELIEVEAEDRRKGTIKLLCGPSSVGVRRFLYWALKSPIEIKYRDRIGEELAAWRADAPARYADYRNDMAEAMQ